MSMKLFWNAIIKFSCGVILTAALLLLPAGTLNYPHAWLFMALLFIPMFIGGIFMMFKNLSLLEHRLNAKEKEHTQDIVIKLSGLMFIVSFVLAGLNYRFNWTSLPKFVVIIASIIFLVAYLLYCEVLRENTFLSRTIEVQANQTVVDTGLYGIVRHPMYSVTLLLFMSMPLILNSWPSFLILLFYPFIIIARIKNEEEVLKRELRGYEAYTHKVKYRLIPYIY